MSPNHQATDTKRSRYTVTFPLVIYNHPNDDTTPETKVKMCELEVWANDPEKAAKLVENAIQETIDRNSPK